MLIDQLKIWSRVSAAAAVACFHPGRKGSIASHAGVVTEGCSTLLCVLSWRPGFLTVADLVGAATHIASNDICIDCLPEPSGAHIAVVSTAR